MKAVQTHSWAVGNECYAFPMGSSLRWNYFRKEEWINTLEQPEIYITNPEKLVDSEKLYEGLQSLTVIQNRNQFQKSFDYLNYCHKMAEKLRLEYGGMARPKFMMPSSYDLQFTIKLKNKIYCNL
jgi:hypothetical protein